MSSRAGPPRQGCRTCRAAQKKFLSSRIVSEPNCWIADTHPHCQADKHFNVDLFLHLLGDSVSSCKLASQVLQRCGFCFCNCQFSGPHCSAGRER